MDLPQETTTRPVEAERKTFNDKISLDKINLIKCKFSLI